MCKSISCPKILYIGTDKSEQTVEAQIRHLLIELSDQCLHSLALFLHRLDALLLEKTKLFNFEE